MGRMRRLGVASSLFLVMSAISGCTSEPLTPQQILAQGADAWNQWRAEHPDAKPDLSGISLEKAALSAVHLEQLRLVGAHLRDADLSGAFLQGADLSGADLSGANLARADLTGTNLEGARMTGAKLNGAQLVDAKLARADIGGADLASADLSGATIDAVVRWEAVASFQDANIYRVILAPSGFKDFALAHGAKKES